MALSYARCPCWQVAADAAGSVRGQARHQRCTGLRQLPGEPSAGTSLTVHGAAMQQGCASPGNLEGHGGRMQEELLMRPQHS